jgi:hypothetical protein
MGAPQCQEEYRPYTYSEYKTWGENRRCELLDGYVYNFASPTRTHQNLTFMFGRRIADYLDDKPC